MTTHQSFGSGCSHTAVGDPHAEERLRGVADVLSAALRAEDRADLDAAVAAVRDEVARDALDLNPRTRAQVRGLEMVLRLLDAGDEGAALDLLDGELSRSFTGRADLSVAERHPGPTGR